VALQAPQTLLQELLHMQSQLQVQVQLPLPLLH
jgi:hypothetical protein